MSETQPTPDESTPSVADEDADVNVRIEDFSKIYQESSGEGVLAVEDLSIDIRRGEFLVLVGPSGCGKTTTLRTVAGLETATEGSVYIEDEDVTGQDPRQRGVSMVFQNYALYPHKTVRENMAFPLKIRSYPDDEISDRVDHIADLLAIEDLLDRKPSQLSGGQQQRVALGRAIVREPAVFLMDEPLSNLDAKLRVQMRTELKEIHRKVGKTTIYVTHDQAEAMTLGDRVAVLNEGELQQIGPPQRLYDDPVNRFVAGFIGEPPMNFVPVTVQGDDDRYAASSSFFELDLPERVGSALDAWDGSTEDLTLGIRPEDLDDASSTTDADDAVFQVSVKVVEPMGSDKFVTFTPPGERDDEYKARVRPDSSVTAGDRMTLVPDLQKIHLFDERSGTNITH